MNKDMHNRVVNMFTEHFQQQPDVVAYAPGRIEILGNHTDYNEGYVMSCAINAGTLFLASRTTTPVITLTAADVNETVSCSLTDLKPARTSKWANYIKGVIAGLIPRTSAPSGMNALFFGNVPVGSGLSSSAALEISTALAVADLWKISLSRLDAAKIGQKAEHDFAGAKCGLLDQISSLYGKEHELVVTDFRSLEARNTPFHGNYIFLACNTHAKHALVDGAYNERRESCEGAAEFFAKNLPHPVSALRDVSMQELQSLSKQMEPHHAMRSAHIIGENERVLKGIEALKQDDFKTFGELMYASHESSISNFENSCDELDFIVDSTRRIPGVLGARLSGGGFGGSVIVLCNARDVDTIGKAVSTSYKTQFNQICDIIVIKPSEGAKLVI